jgi:hypothetical protein
MLRRDKTPLHEQLLAQGASEVPLPAAAAASAGPPAGRRRAVAIGLVIGVAFLALHFLVYIPLVGAWLAPIAIVGVNVWFRRKRLRAMSSGLRRSVVSGIRGAFLIWLAVALAALVLVALDGFQKDDRVLLAVVFLILATLWASQEAIARRRRESS